MDLLKLADDYQSKANDLPEGSLAQLAAENAADKIRFTHRACQQADALLEAHNQADVDHVVNASPDALFDR
jgi:hypothetical protein